MNLNALRTWGIAVSSAAMAGALAIAFMSGPTRTARAEAPQPVFEIAQAGEASAVAFLVRFQGSGPIARAQASAARGGEAQAARQITAQLSRQRGMSGLCFDRFTVGAAEVVLRSCEPVAASERQVFQQRWLQRLRAMRAVAYADINTTASPARAPG